MRIIPEFQEVQQEIEEAISKFPPIHSPHEGLGIMLEEYKELEAEIFKQHDVRTKEKMRHEAKQLAAMAIRFMMDCTR